MNDKENVEEKKNRYQKKQKINLLLKLVEGNIPELLQQLFFQELS
jgi:hypothetical protein